MVCLTGQGIMAGAALAFSRAPSRYAYADQSGEIDDGGPLGSGDWAGRTLGIATRANAALGHRMRLRRARRLECTAREVPRAEPVGLAP